MKAIEPHLTVVRERYATIAPDVQGINAWRYWRQYSSGNQEFVEAMTFQHYLETQKLLEWDEMSEAVAKMGTRWKQGQDDEQELDAALDTPVLLPLADYLLGIFDMTGEL